VKQTTCTSEELQKRLERNLEDLVQLDDISPFNAGDYLEMEYGERELRKMERVIRKWKIEKSIRTFLADAEKILV